MQDAYNGTFGALIGTDPKDIQFKTNSRDKEFLTGRVLESEVDVIDENGEKKHFAAHNSLSEKNQEEQKESSEKTSQIASITKTFTAAALVKMAADKKYSEFFNQDDPMATPISAFENLINKHSHENVRQYWAELKKAPHYEKVTLRHLLNHSSGLGSESTMLLFSELGFRENQNQQLHIESYYHQPETSAENFDKMNYANFTYDVILRPIMESLVGEVANRKVEFSEIIKEQIITPLNLTKTFMSDEMGYDENSNRVIVKERPEIAVAQGYDYFNGKVTSGQDFNYDKAAGGIYSTAEEVAKFYQALLSKDSPLFDERAKQIFFDEKNFIESDEPSNQNVKNSYGLGIRKAEGFGKLKGTEFFHHGGAGLGFYSHVIGQRNINENGEVILGSVKVASTMLSYENLTRPIAAALLGDEKKDEKGNFFTEREWKENGEKKIDRQLIDKMDELARSHSQEELITMRNELEKIRAEKPNQTFVEHSAEFQKIYSEKFQIPSTSMNPSETKQLEENVRQK
jgi:CubicO group peptidase (beta-lactamase class C family)